MGVFDLGRMVKNWLLKNKHTLVVKVMFCSPIKALFSGIVLLSYIHDFSTT